MIFISIKKEVFMSKSKKDIKKSKKEMIDKIKSVELKKEGIVFFGTCHCSGGRTTDRP